MNEAFFISNKRKKRNHGKLKIELELPDEIIKYLRSSVDHEEKGAVRHNSIQIRDPEIAKKIKLPIKSGERFEVADGHIVLEGNKCFYVANFQKIK